MSAYSGYSHVLGGYIHFIAYIDQLILIQQKSSFICFEFYFSGKTCLENEEQSS